MPVDSAKANHREECFKLLDAAPSLTPKELADRVGCHKGTALRAKQAWQEARSAPEVREVPLDSLVLDAGTQMRPAIDEAVALDYGTLMGEGHEFPPVEAVELDDGRLLMTNGFHRAAGARIADFDTIKVAVTKGTLRDALRAAIRANRDNPLQRCEATKRNAVLALLDDAEWGKFTTAQLAEEAGVSWTLADKVRKEYGRANGLDPDAPRLGRDGREYAARTPRPAEASPPAREVEPAPNGHAPIQPPAREVAVEREVGEDDADPAASDPDGDFLASLPLTSKLPPETRPGFEADALLYLRLSEAREGLGNQFRRHKGRAESGAPSGLFAHLTDRYLRAGHPRDYKVCLDCHGKGCGSCHRRGYVE